MKMEVPAIINKYNKAKELYEESRKLADEVENEAREILTEGIISYLEEEDEYWSLGRVDGHVILHKRLYNASDLKKLLKSLVGIVSGYEIKIESKYGSVYVDVEEQKLELYLKFEQVSAFVKKHSITGIEVALKKYKIDLESSLERKETWLKDNQDDIQKVTQALCTIKGD